MKPNKRRLASAAGRKQGNLSISTKKKLVLQQQHKAQYVYHKRGVQII